MKDNLSVKDNLIVKALDSSSLAIAVLNTSNNIIWASAHFFQLINHREDFKPELCVIDFIKPLLAELTLEHLKSAIASKQSQTISCLPTKSDSQVLSIHLSEVVSKNRTIVILPHEIDIKKTNKFEFDTLTGLGNRVMFDRILRSPIRNNEKDSPAIMIIDLDHFKRINDTLGHPVGDQLLKLVGTRFRKLIRLNDCLMRLGGDEFVIVIQNKMDLPRLRYLAERFVASACKTFIIQSNQIDIGASIGIAVADASYEKWDELYRHADLALYESKQLGRSRVSVFSPKLEQCAQDRRKMEIGLRRGLVKNEFYLAYLPQIDVTTNTLMGFEAVLQWHNSKLGFVEPDKFYPVAENIGEINKIGHWAFEQAIKEAKNWPSNYSLSLNMTLGQLLENGLASFLASLLGKYDLASNNVEFILPGKTLLETRAHEPIKSLSDIGIKIALDDPTTGYESLRQLKNIPISRMRVHRDFVHIGDEKSADTIKAIADIGDMLGVPVVAQGIKNENDFWQLKDLGFQELQGFFTSSPLTVNQVRSYLAGGRKQSNREGLHEEQC